MLSICYLRAQVDYSSLSKKLKMFNLIYKLDEDEYRQQYI